METQSVRLRDYFELCKPRVVALMILTSMVGMCLAKPTHFSWVVFLLGNVGIALVAASAAAINHLVDRHIDRLMHRTKNRPIAQGKVSTKYAIMFATTLCVTGLFVLIEFVNTLTALLTFLTLIGYAGIYTMYLKHATPQNIVIGGIAGAAPPLLGWVAMTGHIDLGAIVLLLIIFVWTPPHFWALAIYRVDEYAKADVPMLPVTHGIAYTKLNIVIYTVALFAVTLLPFVVGMSGWVYLVAAILLGARFIQMAIQLKKTVEPKVAMAVFRFSITYLMGLFIALVVDRFV
ncbi:MAG: protoheme IX farnesyltransferase [Gammaproteobacteria bacterium RIFCSPHIGHO2_12_FULL_40_19]|nr:MAG: protoheme IX farnesyltransferase [Gammaproteobacteria bacterium RIFCSPHIGHO2_12_FULL_40_19]